MKKMRRLIPAIAMLLVSAVMLSTASFAWFTMSTEAKATGMQVTATAGSSLLILNKDDGVTVNNFLTAGGTAEFSAEEDLEPATHMDGYANLLATVENPSEVDVAAGTYDGDDYVDATAGTNFITYSAVIAVAGQEAITAKDLFATITINDSVVAELINNAVTIDFWISTGKNAAATYVTGDNLVGSVNLYTVKNDQASTHDTTNGTSSLEVKIAENITIPLALQDQNTLGDYITVEMKVYFDGALTYEGTDGDLAYVRNALISDTGAAFTVNFEVKNTTATQG